MRDASNWFKTIRPQPVDNTGIIAIPGPESLSVLAPALLSISLTMSPVRSQNPGKGPFKLKRFLLVTCFVFLFIPFVANAKDGPEDHRHHRRISADEMAVSGLAAAAVLGAVGYLVLRRRHSA